MRSADDNVRLGVQCSDKLGGQSYAAPVRSPAGHSEDIGVELTHHLLIEVLDAPGGVALGVTDAMIASGTGRIITTSGSRFAGLVPDLPPPPPAAKKATQKKTPKTKPVEVKQELVQPTETPKEDQEQEQDPEPELDVGQEDGEEGGVVGGVKGGVKGGVVGGVVGGVKRERPPPPPPPKRRRPKMVSGSVGRQQLLITRPGLINVDFADVRTVMSEMGMAMMGSGTSSGEDRAREAAEAAISSPLLEDINLAGANGMLVNVTAGMDLSIGEFQEVGNTIKEFSSEEATVVIGTVIDPDMGDKIRVTVVATGLGQQVAKANAPMRVVRRPAPQPAPAPAPVMEPNYQALDKPTVQRKRAVGDGLHDGGLQEELLDIPAFLRRQAD